MLGSEQQLNDDSIIPNLENLEAILGKDDIATQDFQDLEAILNEYNIITPDFEDLKAILSEDSFINQDFENSEAIPNEYNITASKFQDLKVKSNEVDNQNFTPFVNDQTTQPQDKESQNSTIDKAEPGSSDILQQALAIVFDNDTDNLREGSATQASSNLATVLEEKDTAILDLKAILDENDILQALDDLSTTSGDGNAISSTTEALDNAKGINEITNHSPTPPTCNKSIQTQDEELQNSPTEFDLKEMLRKILLLTCNGCNKKFEVIFGSNIINSLLVVRSENSKTVKSLLNATINNENSKKTRSLLHSAIKNNNLETIKKLLHSGADINERYGNDNIPLYIAIRHNNIDTLNALLKFNPDIELRNSHGSTPLHGAIRYCNLDIIDALLKLNPNVESRDNYGNTPLHTAVSRMHIQAIRLLLDYGADSNAQDSNGDTALHKVINSKNSKAILCLKQFLANKNINLNIKNNRGESFISAVLNKFKTLNQIDKKEFGQYLRLVAEHYDRLYDESKLIIQRNNEFNAIIEKYRSKPQQTYSSVFNSIKSCNDRAEMVQVLQLHEFKIDNKNADGCTLLHRAVSEPLSLARVMMLLDINTDVDLQNDRGSTALHIVASSDKKLAITKVLLSYGANANLQNVSGQIPLHIAAARSSLNTLEVLLNFSDIDPNKQDMLGNTALHNALRSKMPFRTVELLLKNDKISLNIKNKEGQCFTSIVLDAFKKKIQGNEDLVKLLVKCYNRLSNESKLIIKSNSEFYAVIEEYRKDFIPYNILNQPSSSSFANEFFNIAK